MVGRVAPYVRDKSLIFSYMSEDRDRGIKRDVALESIGEQVSGMREEQSRNNGIFLEKFDRIEKTLNNKADDRHRGG